MNPNNPTDAEVKIAALKTLSEAYPDREMLTVYHSHIRALLTTHAQEKERLDWLLTSERIMLEHCEKNDYYPMIRTRSAIDSLRKGETQAVPNNDFQKAWKAKLREIEHPGSTGKYK